MRNSNWIWIAGLLPLSVAVWAAAPVATVTSAQPFRLSGATVPVTGVPSWPVGIGDELATQKSPAVLKFHDGTRIMLGRHSRVVLERVADKVEVRLREGSLRFRIRPKSNVAVSGLELPALPQSSAKGSLWVFRDAAYLALTPPSVSNLKQEGAAPVQMTPFNLGYLDALHNYDPQNLAGPTGTSNNVPPPEPPPGFTEPDTGHLQSISPTRP